LAIDNVIFRVHALQRMFERGISVERIIKVVESGETIEDYSSEMPEPSRLILGYRGKRPIHVVVSEDPISKGLTVITAYAPEPDKWRKDYRNRK